MARVVVTGANSGIGLATAVALADRGHDVVGTVRSDEKGVVLERYAQEHGVRVQPMVLRLDDVASSERALSSMEIDVLVNNASFTNMGAIEDVDDDAIKYLLEVNLLAPVRLARSVVPQMRERGSGRIVTVSSILADFSLPLHGWYDASKHGLNAVMESLRIEVASSGIRVVLVQPGAIRTPIYERQREELATRPTSHHDATYARWCRLTRLLEPLMSRPERAAKTIIRAVEAERPRSHYRVGRGAHIGQRILRALPSRAGERLLRTPFGL